MSVFRVLDYLCCVLYRKLYNSAVVISKRRPTVTRTKPKIRDSVKVLPKTQGFVCTSTKPPQRPTSAPTVYYDGIAPASGSSCLPVRPQTAQCLSVTTSTAAAPIQDDTGQEEETVDRHRRQSISPERLPRAGMLASYKLRYCRIVSK